MLLRETSMQDRLSLGDRNPLVARAPPGDRMPLRDRMPTGDRPAPLLPGGPGQPCQRPSEPSPLLPPTSKPSFKQSTRFNVQIKGLMLLIRVIGENRAN